MNFQKQYDKQIKWLMEGDPAIRYQTLRDLVSADAEDIEQAQSQLLKKGWGKRFMELQEPNGTWSNALYSPKWTSTFYTALLLKKFGAPAHQNIIKACKILLDKGFYDNDGGINYWKTWKQGECCITGMLLSMLCYFHIADDRIQRMVEFLIAEQMPDKGWNCERYRGAKHSSFHTTISVLEGLWEYEKQYPNSTLSKTVQKLQIEGIKFLLQHRLYKSSTTWQTVDSKMIKLAFPSRWYYDIMRCLDYFQEKDIDKDERMTDAVELLLEKQTTDGVWKLEHKYPNKVFFDMEKVGKPSRWNTLRALRIIKWLENID